MSLKVYGRYKKAGMHFNNKLMESECLGKDALARAGEALGIRDKSGTMIFNSELEMHATMDLALCDLKGVDGRTPVQAYMEDIGPDGEMERALLEARINSATSLYRVAGGDPGRGTVALSDLLHGGGDVTIYDKGLSLTAGAGAGGAIFIRLFRFPELNTASGIAFVFSEDRVPAMVRKYSKMRERPGRRGPVSRYALFFRLHRRYGVPSLFTDEVL